MKRYTTPGRMSRAQFPENLQAGKLAVMRSAHVSASGVYPMARAYVYNSRGARVTPGPDISASAIDALHRHAQRAESEQAPRPTWQTRRAA